MMHKNKSLNQIIFVKSRDNPLKTVLNNKTCFEFNLKTLNMSALQTTTWWVINPQYYKKETVCFLITELK